LDTGHEVILEPVMQFIRNRIEELNFIYATFKRYE